MSMRTTTPTKAKPQIIYAIDPDADKSGIAKLTVSTRRLDAVTMTFPELIDYFRTIMREAEVTNQPYLIVIEAGWLIKTHWHLGKGDSQQYAAAKGNAVGRNHETGRKLAEMCAHWNMPYKLIKPLPLKIGRANLWSGKDGKITAAELAEITGFSHRSNQESRDAALIAWVEAGLPTRIKPKFNR